ncbi:hypothetical protein RYX36_005630 [Vicia faba]
MDSSLANARNLSRKTGGKRKIEERNVGDKKDDVRGYFTWNLDMDHVLAETVIGENVKNCIKLWRGWYGIVSDILSQSGFDWDGTKCMINVEDENA